MKTEADGLKTLTTVRLREWGILKEVLDKHKSNGVITWTTACASGEKDESSIGYTLDYGAEIKKLYLSYVYDDNEIKYAITFTKHPCNFGGSRWFLECPSKSCGRNCTKLYLRNGYFKCRKCHFLTYASNNRSKQMRLLYSAFRCNPEFPLASALYDKTLHRHKRYPMYLGKHTKATVRLKNMYLKSPSILDQLTILNKSLGIR